MSSDVDVVVIGAGAAGLAAGLTLAAADVTFKVIEARDRIGGRAWTDHHTFPNIAFDRGCHWLHCGPKNPFVEIARACEFRFKTDTSWRSDVLFLGDGRRASKEMAAAARQAVYVATDRFAETGKANRDVALSDVLDRSDPWYPLTYRTLTQMTSGDPEQCSTLDFARSVEIDEDFPVEDGLGALVLRNAAGLPVERSTAAYHLDWSGAGIRVETARGIIDARCAIVAIPTSVMAAGHLRFTPELPPPAQQAMADCPLGSFEKYAFLLDQPIDGLGHCHADVIDGPPLARRPFNLHVNPFGRPLLVGHIGGSIGRELEKAGEAVMYDTALSALVHAFGSEIRKRILKCDFTHWSSDPQTLGAYSHCLPGCADARVALNEPVGDRICFAGEHCSIEHFATVHGAHLSGVAAAERVLTMLRRTATTTGRRRAATNG